MEVTLPLTKEFVKTLKVGDVLYLTGYVYTADCIIKLNT